MSTNIDSQSDVVGDDLEKSSEENLTSSNTQINDRLLTSAFEEQIKLVDQSTLGKNKESRIPSVPAIKLASKKKMKAKTTAQRLDTKQDSNLIFTNRSRKFRFEEDSPDQSAETNENCRRQGRCIIPPPADLANFPQIENEDEAHSSMLMSWYMAGYHTGYYQAMKKLR